LADQVFGLENELLRLDFVIGDLARHAHQLFLLVQQAQTHPLLCIFQVSRHGFLFAVYFFQTQIAECEQHHQHEEDDRHQRAQHGKSVLCHGVLLSPPSLPP
jgi:hypothetical protein